MTTTRDAIARLAAQRAGVLSAREALALGADQPWLTRQVRSGRWQRLHRGVLLTHSGPVSWDARSWGAVLYAGRHAALSHHCAAYLHGLSRRPPETIDVVIPTARRVTPTPGVRIHRRSVMPALTGWPLRTALPETAVDLVAGADSLDAVLGWLSDAVRAGATPRALRRELARRPRLRNRAHAALLLAEVEVGVESPLEGRFHRDVERAHGLPSATLQLRQVLGDLRVRADRVYRGLGVRAELDGTLAHPRGRTDADTWRDNAALIHAGDLTLRYRWSHVASTPCATAAQVLTALRLTTPDLRAHPCRRPGCAVR